MVRRAQEVRGGSAVGVDSTQAEPFVNGFSPIQSQMEETMADANQEEIPEEPSQTSLQKETILDGLRYDALDIGTKKLRNRRQLQNYLRQLHSKLPPRPCEGLREYEPEDVPFHPEEAKLPGDFAGDVAVAEALITAALKHCTRWKLVQRLLRDLCDPGQVETTMGLRRAMLLREFGPPRRDVATSPTRPIGVPNEETRPAPTQGQAQAQPASTGSREASPLPQPIRRKWTSKMEAELLRRVLREVEAGEDSLLSIFATIADANVPLLAELSISSLNAHYRKRLVPLISTGQIDSNICPPHRLAPLQNFIKLKAIRWQNMKTAAQSRQPPTGSSHSRAKSKAKRRLDRDSEQSDEEEDDGEEKEEAPLEEVEEEEEKDEEEEPSPSKRSKSTDGENEDDEFLAPTITKSKSKPPRHQLYLTPSRRDMADEY